MGSILSSSKNREKIEMALSKAKLIVESNPVVVFSFEYSSNFETENETNFWEELLQQDTLRLLPEVKQLFSELQATYKLIELDEESDGAEIQLALAEWTGQRTVPNVFIGGKQIGGSDEVVEKHGQGKLIPLLSEAGAMPKSSTHL